MQLSDHDASALVSGQDNTLHSHSFDRNPTHATLEKLQALEKQTNVTTTYLATSKDDFVLCDTTGGSFTVTLYFSKGGRHITVIMVKGTGVVTVAAAVGDTINGFATATVSGLNTPLRLKALAGWGWVNA